MKIYFGVMLSIIFLLILILTNPTFREHNNAVKSKLSNNNPGTREGLGFLFLEFMIDSLVENFMTYDNYGLFSTSNICYRDNSKIIGFGILGNVFTVGELEEILNDFENNENREGLFFNHEQNQEAPDKLKAGDLQFLFSYNGKYPREVKLLDNSVLKPRLRKMLGFKYEYLKSFFGQVQTPMVITNGCFYAWGMEAHSAGSPSAALLVDLNDRVLYVDFHYGMSDTVFSEDGSKLSPKLQDIYNREF